MGLGLVAAEVAAILIRTDPLLRLIVCDAGVNQVQDFPGREGAKLRRRLGSEEEGQCRQINVLQWKSLDQNYPV